MSYDWRTSASVSSGVTKVNNIDVYLRQQTGTPLAPIDEYYLHRTRAITTAAPALMAQAPWLSGYVVASIISALELYFRQIFSEVLALCPDSRKLSAEQSVHLGAVLWHGDKVFSLAAFEHISFAGSDKIKKCSKDFIGFEISKNSNTSAALEEFDKICELRHGIVHSGLVLPGKNAIKLRATRGAKNSIIEFDIARIHEATSVCTALVESYNAELFEKMIGRWATTWRLAPSWNPQDESKKFKRLCEMFHSVLNKPADRPSSLKLRNIIKNEFNI